MCCLPAKAFCRARSDGCHRTGGPEFQLTASFWRNAFPRYRQVVGTDLPLSAVSPLLHRCEDRAPGDAFHLVARTLVLPPALQVEKQAMKTLRMLWLSLLAVFVAAAGSPQQASAQAQSKPNILFIMGDDIGWMQPSIYHRGLMVGETPNIDKIGQEGALADRKQAVIAGEYSWRAQSRRARSAV